MGSAIAYGSYGKTVGMTNIVLCPSHLLYKWKREVETVVPNAKGYVVNNITDLIAIEHKIKSKSKKEHSFIIISKDSAKFSYEERPSAVYSTSRQVYQCPTCGQTLMKMVSVGTGRGRRRELAPMVTEDFLTPLAINAKCGNSIRKFNTKTNEYEEADCNSKLWVPFNKDDERCDWLKIGKEGWINKKALRATLVNYTYMSRDRKQENLYGKLLELEALLESGEKQAGIKAPRKYSIAKYIRENFKGEIDFAIMDELHLYKGNSKQGQAMADIASAANKFIGLTGTLLNGYANGLFYILYRTLPQLMKKDGLEYSDEAIFQREYGVIEEKSIFATGGRLGPSKEKALPGVSPIVFTKFLLQNALFLSLSDMDGGLPSYEEIPLGVEMDTDLRTAYQSVVDEFKRRVGGFDNSDRIEGTMLQTLSVYPDMPYNQPPIYSLSTNEKLFDLPDLGEGLRNKERELLRIIQEKKENGEKVLVYYEWTNRTDIAKKVTNMLKEHGIKVAVLDSKVKSSEREEWIARKVENDNIDVLICNPKLVETGLDLLAFTSIIFYQVGYNIFTLRQASRRSWRLSQTRDIKVYFLYYNDTIQAQALSLMAGKLQASMAIEGKFSEEGLRAMSDNDDLLSKITSSVVEGIKNTVEPTTFTQVERRDRIVDGNKIRYSMDELLFKDIIRYPLSYLNNNPVSVEPKKTTKKYRDYRKMLGFFNNLHVGNLL